MPSEATTDTGLAYYPPSNEIDIEKVRPSANAAEFCANWVATLALPYPGDYVALTRAGSVAHERNVASAHVGSVLRIEGEIALVHWQNGKMLWCSFGQIGTLAPLTLNVFTEATDIAAWRGDETSTFDVVAALIASATGADPFPIQMSFTLPSGIEISAYDLISAADAVGTSKLARWLGVSCAQVDHWHASAIAHVQEGGR